MKQPTLASIPGILLRTILNGVARVLFLVGGVLLLGALFLMTWQSARGPKTQAITDILLAIGRLINERR